MQNKTRNLRRRGLRWSTLLLAVLLLVSYGSFPAEAADTESRIRIYSDAKYADTFLNRNDTWAEAIGDGLDILAGDAVTLRLEVRDGYVVATRGALRVPPEGVPVRATDKVGAYGQYHCSADDGLLCGLGDAAADEPAAGFYYHTLSAAVADVNAGTPGANASAAADAVLLCQEGSSAVVTLLRDTEIDTTLALFADMTLDLDGHVLTARGITAVQILSGRAVIDGRKVGSAICVTEAGGEHAITLSGGTAAVLGGSYRITDSDKNSAIRVEAGELDMEGVEISADGTGFVRGMDIAAQATVRMTDSRVRSIGTGDSAAIYCFGTLNADRCELWTEGGKKARALNVQQGTATISNSRVEAYADYVKDGEYQSHSQGMLNYLGTLKVNDCYVFGLHSGIQNAGTLYINGGIYEGYGHGGIYFGNNDTVAYVQDAVLRECAKPEGYVVNASYNRAGCYIGGGSTSNRISVYMDNCDITGSQWGFVLRGTSNEKDNKLCISNSRVSGKIRIDHESHRLYMGAGNAFSAENAASSTGVPMPQSVIYTNETYRFQD